MIAGRITSSITQGSLCSWPRSSSSRGWPACAAAANAAPTTYTLADGTRVDLNLVQQRA